MKSLSAPLAAHVAGSCLTLAWGMRVQRTDGSVSGWTNHHDSKTVTVGGASLTLQPTNSMTISAIARTMGLGVDNLEATVLQFDEAMTKLDLLAGRWDGARFYIFQFNWASPSDGLIPWISGKFGNLTPQLGAFTIELRDLRQELANDTTRVLQPNCDYEFGDARCKVAKATHTYAGAVTAVASQQQFTTNLANADDDFAEGEITWVTGLNTGLRMKVRAHAAGVLTLRQAAVYAISVGDSFNALRGCAKTRTACIAFGNVLRFPGADMKPSADGLTRGDVEGLPPSPNYESSGDGE